MGIGLIVERKENCRKLPCSLLPWAAQRASKSCHVGRACRLRRPRPQLPSAKAGRDMCVLASLTDGKRNAPRCHIHLHCVLTNHADSTRRVGRERGCSGTHTSEEEEDDDANSNRQVVVHSTWPCVGRVLQRHESGHAHSSSPPPRAQQNQASQARHPRPPFCFGSSPTQRQKRGRGHGHPHGMAAWHEAWRAASMHMGGIAPHGRDDPASAFTPSRICRCGGTKGLTWVEREVQGWHIAIVARF